MIIKKIPAGMSHCMVLPFFNCECCEIKTSDLIVSFLWCFFLLEGNALVLGYLLRCGRWKCYRICFIIILVSNFVIFVAL